MDSSYVMDREARRDGNGCPTVPSVDPFKLGTRDSSSEVTFALSRASWAGSPAEDRATGVARPQQSVIGESPAEIALIAEITRGARAHGQRGSARGRYQQERR